MYLKHFLQTKGKKLYYYLFTPKCFISTYQTIVNMDAQDHTSTLNNMDYPFIYLSIHLSIYLYLDLDCSRHGCPRPCQYTTLQVLPFYLSIHTSIYLSIYTWILTVVDMDVLDPASTLHNMFYPYIYLSIHLSIYLSIPGIILQQPWIPKTLPVHYFTCFTLLSIYPCIYLYIYLYLDLD